MKAIVIYGCGPQDADELTPIGELNVEAGVKLFHQLFGQKVRIIPTGGRTGKSYFSEAEIMGRRLRQLGVPNEQIVLEPKATNTIENVVLMTNIVDMIGLNLLIHVTPQHHLPRIRELCFLVGIDEISEYCPSQEILGESHPLVKKTEKAIGIQARNEDRWMRGLREIPEYWLPQTAQVESLERFRYILGHQRIQKWLEENFSIFNVSNLTDREIEDIRERIKQVKRAMP